jgi:hypothetical protein
MNDGTPLGGKSTISLHGCSADRPHHKKKHEYPSKDLAYQAYETRSNPKYNIKPTQVGRTRKYAVIHV